MLKISIIEDEPSAQEVLKTYLEKYGKEKGAEFDISCYGDALSFLESYKKGSDIIFMDIELPNLNGMDAAMRLRESDNTAVLIFVTNMAQFAVKGYEADALDFVVKPVSYPAFSMKMDKALRAVGNSAARSINITLPGRVVRLDIRQLRYVEVMGHKLYYHTETETFEGRGSMNAEEQRLKEYNFMRCNSCYLVNPIQVKQVGRDGVEMHGGDVLPISHLRRKSFLAEFAAYIGENK